MRVSVKNRSLILSKVKLSLKLPSASLVSSSPPPLMPSSNGDEVVTPVVSTSIALWPRADTTAPSLICALVEPRNTAAPTAPASAVPPEVKLAAGSSMNISVSSPACSFTEPSVSIFALPLIAAAVVVLTRPNDTEPAPDVPPLDAAIPTTVAVRFCTVSAVIPTLPSAMMAPSTLASTSFHRTLAASATPTDVLDEAAIVPVKSVNVVLSLA